MPIARHGKLRRLLNSHLAKVVKRCPFTTQLLYQSTKETQPVSLSVDAGSKHIGLTATTEKKVVYQEELIPRNNVVKPILKNCCFLCSFELAHLGVGF